jgi:DNA-directed RNA polymerase specialized sigma24 family protein
MNDRELADQISKKLSALIALALLPDVQKRSSAEKVVLLARFNISNQEIADILGTSKGTVEVLKSRTSKRKK